MLLSLNWLREFVPYTGTAEDLGAKLTMLGLELDELVRPFADLEELVVGYVEERAQHPDADKLSVCKVNVGTELLDIVCGAPNVEKGQYVVVAPVGATMPGGLKIKKAKLRGQPSNGMICSERELGLSDDHNGIMVLQDLLEGPFTPGEKAIKALRLDTEVLDIGITPNRADCLSVLGLAREVAMAFDLPLTLPELDYSKIDSSLPVCDVKLDITNPDLSPVYHLKAVEEVKVGRSPAWLRWRLHACGLRSISNVVDVTNYILMELGQPLHSFDFGKVNGASVQVASAADGEKFTTLDGQERTLSQRDITIRDAKAAIALAGVMGGQNSEITDESKAVLLESAVFNPVNIRHTSKRLDISSDAAYRFERGVDYATSVYALERAAIMICSLAGGKTSKANIGDTFKQWSTPLITLRHKRAESLIGVILAPEFCEKTLTSLGCVVKKLENSSDIVWQVTPPSHRYDLEREADLIEELARVYGVDRIPELVPAVTRPLERAGLPMPRHKFYSKVKRWAAGCGLNEAINYSFVGHKDLDQLGLPPEGRISIMNPLSAELDVLRPMLAPGLLNTLRNNVAQGAAGLRVFELAAAFSADPSSETSAKENARLGLLLYGDRYSTAWPRKQEDADYLDIKGFVESFITWLDLPAAEFKMSEQPAAHLLPCVDVLVRGNCVGQIGRVRPEMAENFHARKDVWLAELDLDALYDMHIKVKTVFKTLDVYPPVRRDITVIAPLALTSADILAAIYAAKPANMVEAYMLDLFRKEGESERNLTYRMVFRHAERTLQDAEVDKARDKTVAALTASLGVRV